MAVASIGAWKISIPDGWVAGAAPDKASYLEAPDRTKGIYIYQLAALSPGIAEKEFAAQIQRSTFKSYSELDDSSWKVTTERNGSFAEYHASTMDILDSGSSYCIRFVVMCGPNEGLRLAIHDYLCEDYDEARSFFDGVERSIGRGAMPPNNSLERTRGG
jgi:hypothetical protein